MNELHTILIVDTETTGLDPDTDSIIEIGCVLWSIDHRAIISTYSGLLSSRDNAAEDINGIPPALLSGDICDDSAMDVLDGLDRAADCCVAHHASFDRQFLNREHATDGPWICTQEDVRWPKGQPGASLTNTALAHGCAVVAPHRAIYDCLLMARLFEAVPDIDERLAAGWVRAQEPKVRVVSLAGFDRKDEVKAHRFQWDPEARKWWRVMSRTDAEELPFPVAIPAPTPTP